MGIIKRGRANSRQRAGTTVIAAGTKFVGDVALSDGLHVDGEIEGSVHSESEVSIGQNGRIHGDLQAERVLISGHFDGNIIAARLEIIAGGRVNGDVSVAELVIEPGAHFNGNSSIREPQAPRQLAHDRSATEPDAQSSAGEKAEQIKTATG